MIVGISWRSVSRRTKLYLRIAALAVILLYVLPKLLSLFWQHNQPIPKIREDQLWEKPLRVIADFMQII